MERRVVFITGGSRGIGRATAVKFAREGWDVAIFYLGQAEKAREVKELIEAEGQRAGAYQTNVADKESVAGSFAAAFGDFGRVDALANIAGVSLGLALGGHTKETIDQEIDVNYKGVVFCTQEILKYMENGAMVNITSVSVYGMGPTRDPVYAGTKGAVWAFTRQMATELAPKVRVNAVAPGLCQTDMSKSYSEERLGKVIAATPLGKIAQPEDIANAVYFLASEQAGHITGVTLDVNGGYYIR